MGLGKKYGLLGPRPFPGGKIPDSVIREFPCEKNRATPDTQATALVVIVSLEMTAAENTGDSASNSLAAPMAGPTDQRGCRSAKAETGQETGFGEKILIVAGTRALTTANAAKFRERVFAAMNGHDVIEVDLSETTFMDCGGFGALVALSNAARDRQGRLRLQNPTPPVEQMLTLMEAQRVFEIVNPRPSC